MNLLKMKITSIFLLLILFLALFSNCSETEKSGLNDFTISDTSEITKIVFQGKQTSVLSKKQSQWFVNEHYKAYEKSIERLMQVLSQADVKGRIPAEETDSALKKMNESKVSMQIFVGDKLLKTWIIGYFDAKYNATVVQLDSQTEPYLVYLPGVTKELRPLLTDNPMYWMTAYIFDYEYFELKNISLKYPNAPEKSFFLDIKTDTAFLVSDSKNEGTNLRAVGRYLSYFKGIRFDSLISKDKIDISFPAEVLTVTDNSGKKTELKTFYRMTKDTIPDKHKIFATINDTTAVIVKRYELDLLLKSKSYFTVNK